VDIAYDEDIAKIVSYVTFDGHLSKKLCHFYLSSSNQAALDEFELLVQRKFALMPHLEAGMGFGKSTKYKFYNSEASRALFAAGAPKGDKMLTPFRVPAWIKCNPDFCRAYLSIAFQCEGYIHPNAKYRSYLVAMSLNKSIRILSDGIAFMGELKEMLANLGIATASTSLKRGNARKDGEVTKKLVFGISRKGRTAFSGI